ncbi:MAG: acyl-ACP--UDP-N-acetylglucosamine O-acyltransferase [Candidatus Omnitrophica bacterium]|nr:acyl-ACP--UDP-N-acetylglucosamine O-acyltransferase [Candidatus Omnitrophota bacterium]MDD5429857.1 acyl-ACP--UDP-N-acetylglucosamine O-acyltransferase [Candidatus Omnitrophota bacterium]
MKTQIDKRALVDSSAQLGKNITIGPYAIIGAEVKLGDGCRIDSFAQIMGYTQLGENCHIFTNAVIGNTPQDLKYKGEKTFLFIGKNNIIREFVTINPGTEKGSKTSVGDNNLIMAYSHIAHDCVIGSNNILANASTLAGHVEIGNNVVIGGLVAIHQFCRLGDYSIIGGCSKVVQDIVPYSMCDGHPAVVRGLNLVGLRRADFSRQLLGDLRKAFKILFFEDHPMDVSRRLIKEKLSSSAELEYLLDFISASKRGVSK